MLNRPRHNEDGFTLVELLVAIVILAVITVPLADTVIGVLRNQDDTADRLALSHDSQLSASYFAQDVASVGLRDYVAVPDAYGNMPFEPSVQLGAAYDAGGRTCGTASTPVAAVRLLSDSWDGATTPAALTTNIVAYYLKPGTTELHRLKCTGSATPVSDVVVAHHVDPATVTVTCSSQCDTATVPRQVTLAFSVTLPSVGAYDISLTGERRQT
jgi:prepilin-type N-terminal cleavage/methylation domain-containing protein